MKGFLVSAVLFLLPSLVVAQVTAPRVVTDVELTYRSTMTCNGVSISSFTTGTTQSTQVVASTVTLWGSITIQNVDTAANVFCDDNPSVSTGAANGVNDPLRGFELGYGSPGAAASFYLAPGQLWYCVNDSGSRISSVVVCRGR